MVVVLVIVLPVAILMSGAAGAGLLGWVLKRDVDTTHEGSEQLALSDANPYVAPPTD